MREAHTRDAQTREGQFRETPLREVPLHEVPSHELLAHEALTRIQALEAERDAIHEKWLRAEADLANLRTRAKRDVDETRQYAVQKFAKDVVEVAENIRRGLDSLPHSLPGDTDVVVRVREGFEGIERSFTGLLERNGIIGADPVGKPFDANLHQAMAEKPSNEHPPGTVIQAWSRAWTLNGRLLRPAMVVVSKAVPAPPVNTTA